MYSAAGSDLVGGNTELDSALAGGDVGVGIGGDVGIDPDADSDLSRLRFGNTADQLQLFPRLDIEMPDPGSGWPSEAPPRSSPPR